ncbi:MAG: hypothetical protein A2V83_02270 [Nitrospirae bacterium RBG_16_64_22]|nr:MAG: hypothetical protein A2V83_02270 [Nitrospirae bacterium RBG_16_64_22]
MKIGRLIVGLGKVILFLFFLLAVAVGALWLTLRVATHADEAPAPDLIGRDVVSSLDRVRSARLNLKVTGEEYDSTQAKSHVVSQDPPPGTMLREGRTIGVVVSLGAQEVIVPDLAGQSLRQAELGLYKSGLKRGRVARVSYSGERDTVLSQYPAARSIANRGTPIDLLINMGAAEVLIRVPDVGGHPQAQAEEELRKIGLAAAVKQQDGGPGAKKGVVLEQNPKAGMPAAVGSAVEIVVARSKPAAASPGASAEKTVTKKPPSGPPAEKAPAANMGPAPNKTPGGPR